MELRYHTYINLQYHFKDSLSEEEKQLLYKMQRIAYSPMEEFYQYLLDNNKIKQLEEIVYRRNCI